MEKNEKIKKIRDITMSPINKINEALTTSNGDVDKAIEILIQQKQANSADIAKRTASNNIVYSYVHNHRIGAMIVLASQTDFVAKNELFLELAKDICMHIVSASVTPEYVDESDIPGTVKSIAVSTWKKELTNKPESVIEKIIQGKMAKLVNDYCLLKQRFIKDDTITIEQLISKVSSTVGEKIQLKKFVKFSAN